MIALQPRAAADELVADNGAFVDAASAGTYRRWHGGMAPQTDRRRDSTAGFMPMTARRRAQKASGEDCARDAQGVQRGKPKTGPMPASR